MNSKLVKTTMIAAIGLLIGLLQLPFLTGCSGPGYVALQRGYYLFNCANNAYYKEAAVGSSAKALYSSAIEQFDCAQKFGCADAEMYMERGYAQLQLGHTDKARGDLTESVKRMTEALQRDPNNAGLYNNRGWDYNLLGLYDKAKVDAQKSLSLNAKDGNTHDTLAYALAGLGDDKGALDEYNTAVRLLYRADIFMHRAALYQKLGQTDLAKQDLLRAKLLS